MNRSIKARITQYSLSVASIIAAFCWQLPAQAATPVTPCAIRWDAWYTNGQTDPGHYASDALSLPRWHHLAPIHARFDSAGTITWAPSQETFDAEIRAASSAGLCWAYVMYGQNNIIDLSNPLMRGLAYHRASAIKSSVNYAMIVTADLLGRPGQYESAVQATVRLMRDANYQHVSINGTSRPLLFLLYNATDLGRFFEGSFAKMKEVIDAVRQASADSQLGDPYLVVLSSPAKQAEITRRALGADGISEYVAGTRSGGAQSWAGFEPSIEADWDAYTAATPADAIPTLRSGADIRARCETPPPFDHRFGQKRCDSYVLNPSAQELKSEFRDSVAWIANHRGRDPANLMVVYSWSECDESGNCLMPTIGDPAGQKLKTISEILNPRRAP
jgi:hypothetical protein